MKRRPEEDLVHNGSLAEDKGDTMSEDSNSAGPSTGRTHVTIPASPLIPERNIKAAVPTMRKLMFDLASSSSGSRATQHYHRKALRRALRGPLDRVNVLGDDDGTYGHTGCVIMLHCRMTYHEHFWQMRECPQLGDGWRDPPKWRR